MLKIEKIEDTMDIIFQKMVDDGLIKQVIGEKLSVSEIGNVYDFPAIVKTKLRSGGDRHEGTHMMRLNFVYGITVIMTNNGGEKTRMDVIVLREKILNIFRKIALNGKYEDDLNNIFPDNVWITPTGYDDYEVTSEKDKIFFDIVVDFSLEAHRDSL